MKLTKLPKEFAEAAPLLKKIEAAGYEAYFVGGSVRDTICGSRRSMRSLRFERKQPIKITADPTKWILSVP